MLDLVESPARAGPRWPTVAGSAISWVGLAISAYLTVLHFQGSTPICPAFASVVDCQAVVTSRWSTILWVPVPLLGVLFFAAMLALQSPSAWRSRNRRLRRTRVVAATVGVAMVLWLLYAELFLVGRICLWCTTVHVLTFALFCTTVFGTLATADVPG